MLCEKCGKNEANVYIKNVLNGETREWRLCAGCAAESGLMYPTGFSLQDPGGFFGEIAQSAGEFFPGVFPAGSEKTPRERGVCPLCGAGAADIMKTGRAGCAQCYTFFRGLLAPAVRRIHGGVSHTGMVPGSAGAEVSRRRRLNEMRREMREAIKNEEFESAARLRDEIRALENGGKA